MKEPPKTCLNCKFYDELPFSDEHICTNENSDYADCPCEINDLCSEWTEREN